MRHRFLPSKRSQPAPAIPGRARPALRAKWRPEVEALEARKLLAFAPLGPESRANTTTEGDQSMAAVASDDDGDFVVAWASRGQDGSGLGVYAQRYAATGTPLGGEFLVNTTTAGDQYAPSVAMDADGDFVIAWGSHSYE